MENMKIESNNDAFGQIITKAIEAAPKIEFRDLSEQDEEIQKFIINNGAASFYSEIMRFKIDKAGVDIKAIFIMIDCFSQIILKNHTEMISVMNAIKSAIKDFPTPINMLILQGVLEWIEECELSNSDLGAQYICNEIQALLISYLAEYKVFLPDNAHLQPITNYFDYKYDETRIESNSIDKASSVDIATCETKSDNDESFQSLSIELTNDEQEHLYNSLINGGFMHKETNCSHFCYVFGDTPIPENEKPFKPLRWEKSKSLLAYFVDSMCEKYNLKHGENRKIKPFEKAFNVKGITQAMNDYKKTGQLPVGYKEMDKVLK